MPRIKDSVNQFLFSLIINIVLIRNKLIHIRYVRCKPSFQKFKCSAVFKSNSISRHQIVLPSQHTCAVSAHCALQKRHTYVVNKYKSTGSLFSYSFILIFKHSYPTHVTNLPRCTNSFRPRADWIGYTQSTFVFRKICTINFSWRHSFVKHHVTASILSNIVYEDWSYHVRRKLSVYESLGYQEAYTR